MAHKRVKLRISKKKKKMSKIKLLFYLVVIYASFSYTFYYYLSNKKTVSNEEFINLLVSTGNANILNDYKLSSIVNKTMNFIFDIDFGEPVSFFNGSILEFGYTYEDNKTISLEYNDDYSNMEDLEDVSDYISDPNPVNTSKPIVYLYNSHQLENYSNKDLSIYGITPNVLMASYVLREKLNELGISTIVEDGNMKEILDKNGWNYSYSYKASRGLLEDKIIKYPTLNYFIDIHRDSISYKYSTATIGDKSYAKVMFVIGLEHDGWEDNYDMANKINNLINKYYSGLSRGILKKEGSGVNGIYNQDFNSNCILIEVGGVDNTIGEVYNTMNAIADVLNKYINGVV